MKKIAVFLCSILVSMSFLTSCGMTTDAVQIESVTATLNEETGVTTITIKYLDDLEDPYVFEIPAGQQGVDGLQGVGIKEIKEELDENGERIGITVYYTDDAKEPTFISFTDGKDGISISDVVSEEQADGSIKLTFIDDKGNPVGEPVFVPSGTKITDIKSVPQEDGSIEIEVYYSNSKTPHKFKINAARGVLDVSAELVNNKYTITFSYTDGTTSKIDFDRPNAWISGIGAPGSDDGIVGDFYFDVVNKIIYQKNENGWSLIANLNSDEVQYTVTFVVGENERFPYPNNKFTFNSGESFAANESGYSSVPIPFHRDGYEFLGWYTVKEPTVNHGKFTDLTTISGDLTLYAYWGEVSN